MYSRIVIPLDGSDIAEQAIDSAMEIARLMGTPIHLVRVLDPHPQDLPTAYASFLVPIDTGELEVERDNATQYLTETARVLSRNGQVVTSELRYGPPQAAIADALKEGDLLVISSHGRSGVSRWFLGSVAESVIRQSTVPVLLIRAGKAKAARAESRPAIVGAPA